MPISENVDFFKRSNPDQLELSNFMQAALEANRQRMAAQQDSNIIPQRNATSELDTKKQLMKLEAQLMRQNQGFQNSLQQPQQPQTMTPYQQAQLNLSKEERDIKAAKEQYESQQRNLFEQAWSEGRFEDAKRVDPERALQLRDSEQSMANSEVMNKVRLSQEQLNLANAEKANKTAMGGGLINTLEAKGIDKELTGLRKSAVEYDTRLIDIERAEAASKVVNSGAYAGLYKLGHRLADDGSERSRIYNAAATELDMYNSKGVLEVAKVLKPLSDSDIKFAKETLAGGGLTQASNANRILYDKVQLKRARAYSDFRETWATSRPNGYSRAEVLKADKAWSAFVDANPVFDAMGKDGLIKLKAGSSIDGWEDFMAPIMAGDGSVPKQVNKANQVPTKSEELEAIKANRKSGVVKAKAPEEVVGDGTFLGDAKALHERRMREARGGR